MISNKGFKMDKQTSYFRGLEYPGRFIIGGQFRSSEDVCLAYGLTGRSAASQARRLVRKDNGIWVEPTDPQLLMGGRPDLLIYPAVLYSASGLVVSNGKQTTEIMGALESERDHLLALVRTLKDWKYEPDEPIFTPRISLAYSGGFILAMSLIKRGEFGAVIRNYFELPLIPGKGWLIMTYMGVNVDPVPSFFGEPISVEIAGQTAEEVASEIYDSLAPSQGKNDFRVAVACLKVSTGDAQVQEIKIINRH
jgi:IMP cyclohydrolase